MRLVVKFYTARDGARKIFPDLNSGLYRPHLVLKDDPDGIYLGVEFTSCEGPQAFDTEIQANVKLLYSGVDYSALQPAVRFTIYEGRNTVGEGYVIAARP